MRKKKPKVLIPGPVKKKEPAPVIIADTEKPIPVVVESEVQAPKKVVKNEGHVLAPTTTHEENVVTEGQRRINLIWETTQSRIALLVIHIGMGVNAVVIVILIALAFFSRTEREIDTATVAIITGSIAAINLTSGIVIGFYFSRTNHSQIGGTGNKPTEGPLSRR